MAKLTPADFAAWCWQHLETEVWFTEGTLQRRLAGVSKCPFTAPALLAALIRAGWVTAHPTYPDTWCLPARCWLPLQPKAIT